MASKALVDAVNARLTQGWSICPVIGPNLQQSAPKDGSEFLTVQYPVANGEQISIGSPGSQLWREEGAIRFVLSMPRGSGDSDGLDHADQLAALFRGKQFGGVSTWAPSSAAIDDRNGNGNYWLLSFAVPYYFDLVG